MYVIIIATYVLNYLVITVPNRFNTRTRPLIAWLVKTQDYATDYRRRSHQECLHLDALHCSSAHPGDDLDEHPEQPEE